MKTLIFQFAFSPLYALGIIICVIYYICAFYTLSTTCGITKFGDVNKFRNTMHCFLSGGCRLPEQCRKNETNGVFCDCSGSGYTGMNCETPFDMRWALILYDEDGFTSIERTNTLTGDINQTSVCELKLSHGPKYKVEILQLADTKAELNKYSKTWGLTHRALAIHNAIKKHKGNKKGGFLSIWPSDEENNYTADRITTADVRTSPMDVDTTSTDIGTTSITNEDSSVRMDSTPATGLPGNDKIKGKNNRAISVLFGGAGDYSDSPAEPRRSPNNTDTLTKDQADLLNLQIIQSDKNRSLGAQTLPVVVTNSLEELQNLCVKPQQVEAATQCNMCLCDCAANKEKLDKIFELVQALDQKVENKFNSSLVSIDLIEGMMNNSARSESALNISLRNEANIQQEGNSESNTTTASTCTSQPESSSPQEIVGTVDLVEADSEKENHTSNENIVVTLPQDLTQYNYIVDSSPQVTVIREKHFSHACFSGGIVEICSGADIPLDRNELRIHADLIRQARVNACSVGNFGWILVRKVYASEELVGRNYHGTRGKAALSPRRIHAIEHACLDSYGPGPNVSKLAKAVNTGLRNSDLVQQSTRQVFRQLMN